MGRQHPKMFGKKGSKILKLPPVRNCFTLAMTNKLVVIINSPKVPKNQETFTRWNEISCTNLQLPSEPLTRGYRPQIPVLSVLCPLSSTEFVEPPRTKFLGTPLPIGSVFYGVSQSIGAQWQSYNRSTFKVSCATISCSIIRVFEVVNLVEVNWSFLDNDDPFTSTF